MKNKILKFFMGIVGILFVISVCCLDSNSNIPFYVMMLTACIIALFAYANNWFYNE